MRNKLFVVLIMELDHGGLVKEEYQEIRAVFNNGREPGALTNVVVDPYEELVWVGNQSVSDFLRLKHDYLQTWIIN